MPDLGQVPEIDVPSYLPDLPGVADDLMYSADLGPGIAPSAPGAIPELPAFHTEVTEPFQPGEPGSGGWDRARRSLLSPPSNPLCVLTFLIELEDRVLLAAPLPPPRHLLATSSSSATSPSSYSVGQHSPATDVP